MQRTRSVGASARKKLGSMLVLALLAFTAFAVLAPSAFAHSATLVASTQCPDPFAPNTYTVNFTATSWTSGQLGANPDIHVEYSINNGPFVVGAQFAFPNQATVPSHSGSFTVASATTITSLRVQAEAGANWEAGSTEHGPWDTQTLTLPEDCQPPASPSAAAQLDCSAGGAVVTVTNGAPPGGASVAFTISAPAGSSAAFSQTTAPVGPGGSTKVTVPFVEGETRVITVTAPGGFWEKFTFVRDCEHPAALVSHVCAASGLDVTVKNVGDGSGSFSINGVAQVLAPGESFTRNVAVAEGASVQVTVLLDGSPVAGSPFTFVRDCEHPAALVSHVCAASGLDVTVKNVGDGSGSFSINGVAQVLAPGESFTRNVAVAEGASVQVTVLLDGSPVAGSPFTFVRDCEHPAALVSHVCAASGLDVTVKNVGDGSGSFSINGVAQVLAPGESFTRNVAVAEGASVQVTVLLDGSPVAGSPFTFVRDCEHPAALVSHVCAASGLDVTVKNVGDGSGSFSINGVAQVLAPGESFTRNVAVAEGASVQVTVLLDGSPVAGSPFTFVRDCEHPGARVASNCTTRGADLTLTNTGDSTTTLTVTKGGLVLDTVVVGAGRAVFRSYPLAEDEFAVFRVTAPTFDSGSLIVIQNCVQVGAVVIVSPGRPLAVTGASTEPLAITGGLFVATGTLAVLGARRRRKHLTLR